MGHAPESSGNGGVLQTLYQMPPFHHVHIFMLSHHIQDFGASSGDFPDEEIHQGVEH